MLQSRGSVLTAAENVEVLGPREAVDFLGARRVVIVAGKDWWPDARQRLGLDALGVRSMPIIAAGERAGVTIVATYHPGAHIAGLTNDAFAEAIAAEIKGIEGGS